MFGLVVTINAMPASPHLVGLLSVSQPRLDLKKIELESINRCIQGNFMLRNANWLAHGHTSAGACEPGYAVRHHLGTINCQHVQKNRAALHANDCKLWYGLLRNVYSTETLARPAKP